MHSQPQRVRELFDEALDRPATERRAFLITACGADASLRRIVEQLLADHLLVEEALPETVSRGEQPGDCIGPYKLLERIGEGGFGVVWMAEQQRPIRRRVALKVVKLGMDTHQVVARFEAERQALALMDHPNIARVFDGGATETGRPFFAMELVRGVPITQYCDEARLMPAMRLSLFVSVCEAVQHAHSKGVIHRDLKPSNVLVTLHDGKPVPKVIDFGIAKATQGQLTDKTVFTGFRQMLGTPEYMAPEQAELSGLDVDTRADVYSLGAMLYELLTGTKPFELRAALEAGFAELLRQIKDVDPDKPSTRISTLGARITEIATRRRMLPKGLSSALRGDLDWIVLKAMEKERSRRYATAHAMAEDLERHLRDEPVRASPPSRLYRVHKYLRRHRVGVAAGAAVALAVAAGALASALGYFEARRQEREAWAAERRAETALAAEQTARIRAEREAARSEAVVELLSTMLSSSDPRVGNGPEYPVRMVLAEFDHSLDRLAREPDVEATLRRIAGTSYLGLGMARAAEPHLDRALQLAERRSDRVEIATVRSARATLRVHIGRYEDGLREVDAADTALGSDASASVRRVRGWLHVERSMCLLRLGRLADAETAARAAVELADEDDLARATRLNMLALVLQERGSLPAAETAARQSLQLLTRRWGEEHPTVGTSLTNLGGILLDRDDLDGAEEVSERALAMQRRLLGGDHPSVAYCLNNLGAVLEASERLADAEARFREALDLLDRSQRGEHPLVATVLHNLGSLLVRRGRHEEAEQTLRRALQLRIQALGPDHPDLARSLHNLAIALRELGDLDDAEQMLRDALAMLQRHVRGAHPEVAAGLANLASVAAKRGESTQAVRLHEEALAMQRSLYGEDHRTVARSLTDLAALAREHGDLAAAEDLYGRALAIQQRLFGDSSRSVAASLHHLALVLRERGRSVEAEAALRRALQFLEPREATLGSELATCLDNLAMLLESSGDLDGADEASRRALELGLRVDGEAHPRTASKLVNRGLILQERGELAAAESELRRAIALAERLAGGTFPGMPAAVFNLGKVLEECGRLEEAEGLMRQSLALEERQRGSSHPNVAIHLVGLGGVLHARESLTEAEVVLRRALAIATERPNAGGRTRPVQTLGRLSDVLRKQGNLDEAESCARRSLSLAQEEYGADSTRAATELARLAYVLLQGGRASDAEPLAARCIAIRATRLPGSPYHYAAMALHGRVLAALGRPAEAVPLLAEASTRLPAEPRWRELLRKALTALVALHEQAGDTEAAAPWKERLREIPHGSH